jgi:hypothetical protein
VTIVVNHLQGAWIYLNKFSSIQINSISVTCNIKAKLCKMQYRRTYRYGGARSVVDFVLLYTDWGSAWSETHPLRQQGSFLLKHQSTCTWIDEQNNVCIIASYINNNKNYFTHTHTHAHSHTSTEKDWRKNFLLPSGPFHGYSTVQFVQSTHQCALLSYYTRFRLMIQNTPFDWHKIWNWPTSNCFIIALNLMMRKIDRSLEIHSQSILNVLLVLGNTKAYIY